MFSHLGASRHVFLKQSIRHFASTPLTLRSLLTKPNYAFAFDIDGVLIKGKKPIAEATMALRLLNGDNPQGRRIPFVLLTNGGGMTEAAKASQVSELIDISPDQVILSHSPMQLLTNKYKDKRVLVVGGKETACADLAKGYGFENVVTPQDLHHWNTSLWPYSQPKNITEASQKRNNSFTMSNDLIWSTDFPAPRLGQGAFKEALEGLYKALTSNGLQSESFGKPHGATYFFAEKVIARQYKTIYGHAKLPTQVYAVGDNPAADIKGANAHGWSSMLVRTGIHTGPGNSDDYPADFVCDNVLDAVTLAINKEEKAH
ncbi:hypothetical protein [Absidia glauca]|uniref:TIGR01456 family HAD hydrolase n=1 Tax=Absidia glauca TaxID=4829 RepID=A0A168STZ4_ABSGL|nr:hypothetical protein [Absidia glauca]